MQNKADLQRVIALLKQLECSQGEAEVYIQALKMGPSTVQEIANKLKRNRVTAHSSIEKLIDKGLLFETRKSKKRLIVAEGPDAIHGLIQKEENNLKLLRGNLDHVSKMLLNMQSIDRSKPTVKFYEGVDGFKKMLEETLDAKNECKVFTYVDLFSKLLDPDYLEDYFKRRAEKGIHTRLIFPPCDFATRVNSKAQEYKIRVRLISPEYQWAAGIFSWNNVVSIKSFTEGKITSTLIENEDIAYFYQNLITELCWEMATEM